MLQSMPKPTIKPPRNGAPKLHRADALDVLQQLATDERFSPEVRLEAAKELLEESRRRNLKPRSPQPRAVA